jgi:hypothetical protein
VFRVLSKSVLNAIALVITGVWTLSFLAQFVPALNYDPDPQINLIFGTLVGGAFALPKLLGARRGGGGDDEEEPPGRHRKLEKATEGGEA